MAQLEKLIGENSGSNVEIVQIESQSRAIEEEKKEGWVQIILIE